MQLKLGAVYPWVSSAFLHREMETIGHAKITLHQQLCSKRLTVALTVHSHGADFDMAVDAPQSEPSGGFTIL